MYKCSKCGSYRVQSKAWLNPNINLKFPYDLDLDNDLDFSLSEENRKDDNYCLDCGDHCKLTIVEKINPIDEQYEESEPWNKIVCDNLRGGPYLKVWNNLPYNARQNICESFFEYFKIKYKKTNNS
jgi:hypothetical protein